MRDDRPWKYDLHPVVSQLREERLSRRIGFEAVGEEGGFGTGTICSYESGRHSPRLESLDKWAKALGYRLVLEKIE